MELEEKLRSLRKQRGLSQQEMAEALHVSRQAVSRWETGMAVPSLENLKCIGSLFEVSLDELLGGAAQQKKEANPSDTEKERAVKGIAVLQIALLSGIFLLLMMICIGVWVGNQGNDAYVNDDRISEQTEYIPERTSDLYAE